MCLNLRNGTQVQLDRLDGLVLSIQMKAVETMEIKALVVSKSTYDHLFIN